MAIKSIVVHPKGATHIQNLNPISYFMKLVDNTWFFYAHGSRTWIADTGANESNFAGSYLASLIKPIR